MQRSEINAEDIIGGVKGSLLSNWTYSADAEWTTEVNNSSSPDTNLIAIQNALNGFGGPDCNIDRFGNPDTSDIAGQGSCYYWSPFGKDQANNPPQTMYNILGPVLSTNRVSYYIAEGVVSGQLFNLPAGPVGVAIGGQWRKESYAVIRDQAQQYGETGFSGKNISGEGSRSIKAFFGELDAPVMQGMDLQVAARYEDYGPFNTLDPKIGLNWHALPWLTLRGSASKSFRAPALSQSTGNTVTQFENQTFDPLQSPPDPGTFREIILSSNPKLKPEKSTNYNFGATVEPVENLLLSIDYWHFNFKDQITEENAQGILNSNPNGPQVIRDSTGKLLAVEIGYFNSGSTETDGVDLGADYSYDLGDYGSMTFHNSLSWINSYTIQLGPGQPAVDVVGRRNANNPGAPTPRFRDNLTVNWVDGDNSVTAGMRYTGSVLNDLGLTSITAVPTTHISDWTVFDAQYAYSINQHYKVTVGAINLFDRQPPKATYTGYLPNLEDVLGTQAYVRLDILD